MKKSLLILFSLLLICPAIIFSQNQISAKIGISSASVSGDDVSDDWESRSGIALGTSFVISMGEVFALEPEFMYTENGYSTDRYDLILNYYNLAFLLRLNFKIEKFSIIAVAGPNLAATINSKREYTGSNTITTRQSLVDYGVTFGGGLGYGFDFGILSFDVRYTMGFNSIIPSSDSDDDVAPQPDIDRKNRTLIFMLGYSIPMTD